MTDEPDERTEGEAEPTPEEDGGTAEARDADRRPETTADDTGDETRPGADSDASRSFDEAAALEEESGAKHDTIPAEPSFEGSLAGTMIEDRYLLLGSLGEGGMGQVYRARHVLMDKPVAIKLLHAELAHIPDLTKRFEREARSSSRLSDPHCITVTDFGRTEDGQLYLVMELLEGESLATRIDEGGALEPTLAIEVARQMLMGLAHAHGQGVIHRDLKPENAMLVKHGEQTDFVKILDFGIAKLAHGGSGESLTRSGVVFGTPKYLSPEQALGDEVDHRSDLYAVGIILWEALTGEPPFTAETAMETMSLHLTGDVPRLSEHGSFPRGLQGVLDRALAKKPDERFQSAEEFLAALDEIDPDVEEDRTSPSMIIETIGRITGVSGDEGKKKRRLLTVLLGIVVAAALVAVLSVFLAGGDGERRQTLTSDEFEELGEDAASIRRKLDRARAQIREGNPAEAVITAKKVLKEQPSLASGLLVLGHGQFLSGEREEAMESYELALAKLPDLGKDVRLGEHLRASLEWKTCRQKGALLLARCGGPEGVEFLAEKSNSALTPGAQRRAARAALVEAGHERKVDWLASLTADFHEQKRCKERREIIDKMAEVGDPRFLPLLEERRPVTVRKGGRKVTSNACIGVSVMETIEKLTAIKKDRTSDTKDAAVDG